MKLKKILCSIITIMLFMIVILTQSSTVHATTLPKERWFGIIPLMKNDTPNLGYAILNPNFGGDKIWNIVEYDSSTATTYTNLNIYCVKAKVGFTQRDFSGNRRAAYNVSYNLKTERDLIKNVRGDVLKEVVEGTIPHGTGTINRYDALLAVMDMLYLPGESTQEEKETLMREIVTYAIKKNHIPTGIPMDVIEANPMAVPLTDDDINAVQQAVIWYFTNYGEENFDQTASVIGQWMNYTTDGDTYTNFGDKDPRNYEMNWLYNYMIDKAKEKAPQYTNANQIEGSPIRVDTTNADLKIEEQGENSIVGPIHMTQLNPKSYEIDFIVKNNGTQISNYKLLDAQKQEVASGRTIKDLVGNDFYISIPKSQSDALTFSITVNYNDTTMTLYASETNTEQPLVEVHKTKQTDTTELAVRPFDLALRKYITKVNGNAVTATRNPKVELGKLNTSEDGKFITTAEYKHKKDPVPVEKGNKVTYEMKLYNEGEKAGRATKVIDQLPTGLKFDRIVSGNFELENYNEETNTLTLRRKADNNTNLNGYGEGKTELDAEVIEIECIVDAEADKQNRKILTNVAWIADAIDEDGKKVDRDSQPETKPDVNKDNMENYTGNNNKEDLTDAENYYKGQQDDDDFEKLVLEPKGQPFDLKLIKYITEVNNQKVPERIEKVDVSKLNTVDENGNRITTADYQLNKNAVGVKKGDIVTYTFRVYNEGMINGYAKEITEDIPEGLQFLWSEKEGEELKADKTLTEEEKEAIEFNQKYLWGKFVYDEAGEKIVKISSDYLSKEKETTVGGNLIEAFGENDGTKTEKDIHYKEIAVKFKVIAENQPGTVIQNEAAITEDTDEDGNPVDDRDSKPEEWVKYEDDEDYDKIILQSFDLSLRKFIIAVSKDEQIENNEYLKNEDGTYKRAPNVDTSKLNTVGEDGKLITTAIYNHTKEPVLVQPNGIVVYMLRVYNEGDMDGYASEIKDHLPPYLEFVKGEFNEQYGWQEGEDGRTVTTRYLEEQIIPKAQKDESGKIVLSYKEVPIMCKIKDSVKTSEKITNIADITESLDENKKPATDRDSQEDNVKLPEDKDLPGYKDNETGSYIPGQQDDDDFEKVIVKSFDLALRKWVTQAIVIENGQQKITQTGHQPYDDPEAVVKVELHRKKLNQVTVKFRYSIRVINEGEIEGYAKEVTDYIPEGLKFEASDNPGWTDEGNNVISTRQLENTLLKPGEYADVEVVLTWINNENNMGVMNNTAEISEDYNEYGVPDKDSTPDNKKSGEDDIDDAPVMLSISTGQIRIYFTLGFILLITIASGVVLIKKFVL